jgi:hypothetical protein
VSSAKDHPQLHRHLDGFLSKCSAQIILQSYLLNSLGLSLPPNVTDYKNPTKDKVLFSNDLIFFKNYLL